MVKVKAKFGHVGLKNGWVNGTIKWGEEKSDYLPSSVYCS